MPGPGGRIWAALRRVCGVSEGALEGGRSIGGVPGAWLLGGLSSGREGPPGAVGGVSAVWLGWSGAARHRTGRELARALQILLSFPWSFGLRRSRPGFAPLARPRSQARPDTELYKVPWAWFACAWGARCPDPLSRSSTQRSGDGLHARAHRTALFGRPPPSAVLPALAFLSVSGVRSPDVAPCGPLRRLGILSRPGWAPGALDAAREKTNKVTDENADKVTGENTDAAAAKIRALRALEPAKHQARPRALELGDSRQLDKS